MANNFNVLIRNNTLNIKENTCARLISIKHQIKSDESKFALEV